MREFVVTMRTKLPLGIIDAYYDGEGRALCPMANGISHHISPTGAVEPAPSPVRDENVRDGSIYDILTKSEFLRDFRETAARHTRGCIVLERPDLVKALAEKHGATDTTVRKTAIAELEAMTPRNSQWLPTGEEIPEKNPVYRWAKRIWFQRLRRLRRAECFGGPECGAGEDDGGEVRGLTPPTRAGTGQEPFDHGTRGENTGYGTGHMSTPSNFLESRPNHGRRYSIIRLS